MRKTKAGRNLLLFFPSIEAALKIGFPEVPWESSRFLADSMPRGFWKEDQNLMKVLTKAEQKLGITKVIRVVYHSN